MTWNTKIFPSPPPPHTHVHIFHVIVLTIRDLEHQDSSLSWLFLSNINKCSAHNIEGASGISTFPQGARGQADSLLSLTELVAMKYYVYVQSERERERETERERERDNERDRQGEGGRCGK